MATTARFEGNVLNYVATADIASGDVVVAGKRVGVALVDIANGDTGSVQVTGVFELPKLAGAIAQGAEVYQKADGSGITTTATANTLAGFAWEAAADGDATVMVKLNG